MFVDCSFSITLQVEIDIFSAAVDFELIKNSIDEAEQFAKDYIDCEEKEYQRML